MVMMRSLARLSAIRGVIDRRILANYRLAPEVVAAQLPAPFKPKLFRGQAIGGLCLIRLKQVRPSIMGLPIGFRSENAAHRIAVVWEQNGVQREGVYVPRRDTNAKLNVLAGGRLFPGEHHHAVFTVIETEDRFEVSFQSDDGEGQMHIRAERAKVFSPDSIFGDLATASAFFQAGSLGYSATRKPGCFDGLELDCKQWSVQPLEVSKVASSYFDDRDRFPAGSVSFDSALLMTDIDHAWRQRGVMRCDATTFSES